MSSEATQEEPTEEPTDASETPGPLGLPASGAASWRQPEDEKKLIEYLLEHRAEAGDGTNFKATSFRGAATHVNLTRIKGGPKTGKSCEQKYHALRQDWGFAHHIKGVGNWKQETETESGYQTGSKESRGIPPHIKMGLPG
ncbi:hypothetical protein K438DRAFT_1945226 [Mycena galopus ATCC 62051]|nr:hypothetical protein K438DRAFT_1945226 [Mycena galopus ATCC 62051]